jgi:hypothetical protein
VATHVDNTENLRAEDYVTALAARCSPADQELIRRYAAPVEGAPEDVYLDVHKREVFGLAKELMAMPPDEIEKLLVSPIHELRCGALRMMGEQGASKKTPEERRKVLFDLYMEHRDKINDWRLVDISGHHVVGRYLEDKPRDILYELARSPHWWERRIAMFCTLHFCRKGDLDDTFELAEILLHDEHDKIHTVVGWMLRETGKHDRPRLMAFLDRHAATMPRITLRNAIEHFDKDQRAHYLGLKAAQPA